MWGFENSTEAFVWQNWAGLVVLIDNYLLFKGCDIFSFLHHVNLMFYWMIIIKALIVTN